MNRKRAIAARHLTGILVACGPCLAGAQSARVEVYAANDTRETIEVHLFRNARIAEGSDSHGMHVTAGTDATTSPPEFSIPLRVWLVGKSATEGVDFVAASHSFEFEPADFVKQGSSYRARQELDMLEIIDDDEEEPDETFDVAMTLTDTRPFVSLHPGYPDVSTITIADNDGSNPEDPDPEHTARPPTPPRSLEATAGDRHVVLTWRAPEHDGNARIVRYEYRRRVDGGPAGDWRIIRDRPGEESHVRTRRHRANGLTNGETYRFELRAVNDGGWVSPPSEPAAATPGKREPVPALSLGGKLLLALLLAARGRKAWR